MGGSSSSSIHKDVVGGEGGGMVEGTVKERGRKETRKGRRKGRRRDGAYEVLKSTAVAPMLLV